MVWPLLVVLAARLIVAGATKFAPSAGLVRATCARELSEL